MIYLSIYRQQQKLKFEWIGILQPSAYVSSLGPGRILWIIDPSYGIWI
jgi:hypothetical protein